MSDSQDFQWLPSPQSCPKVTKGPRRGREIPLIGVAGVSLGVRKSEGGGTKDFLFPLHSNLCPYSLLSKMVMVISFTSWEAPA